MHRPTFSHGCTVTLISWLIKVTGSPVCQIVCYFSLFVACVSYLHFQPGTVEHLSAVCPHLSGMVGEHCHTSQLLHSQPLLFPETYDTIFEHFSYFSNRRENWATLEFQTKKKKNQYEYFHTNDDNNDAYDNDDDADDLDMVLASVKAGGNAHKHRMS